MSDNDIFTATMQAAACESTVKVSLTDHSLEVDGRRIIDHGRYEGRLGIDAMSDSEALARIEEAFATFEKSLPDFSRNDVSMWFYAKPADELSDAELATGEERAIARCRIEVLTLLLTLNGSITKHSPSMQGKWFWQSAKHPRLVILADWLTD